jgi:hypothetical protein
LTYLISLGFASIILNIDARIAGPRHLEEEMASSTASRLPEHLNAHPE